MFKLPKSAHLLQLIGMLLFCCALYYLAFLIAFSFTFILAIGALFKLIDWKDIPSFWRWCFNLGFLDKPNRRG